MTDWINWYVDDNMSIQVRLTESFLSNNTSEIVCNYCGRIYSPQYNAYCPFCNLTCQFVINWRMYGHCMSANFNQ